MKTSWAPRHSTKKKEDSVLINLVTEEGEPCGSFTLSEQQWVECKRFARQEHLKVADWLRAAIIRGVEAMEPEL